MESSVPITIRASGYEQRVKRVSNHDCEKYYFFTANWEGDRTLAGWLKDGWTVKFKWTEGDTEILLFERHL